MTTTLTTRLTRTLLVTLLLGAGAAHAEVPSGADAIHGAFERMLAHEPAAVAPRAAWPGRDADTWVEEWTNAVARSELDGALAGFVHMLERTEATPWRAPLAGEPDAVAILVRESLQSQQHAPLAYASL